MPGVELCDQLSTLTLSEEEMGNKKDQLSIWTEKADEAVQAEIKKVRNRSPSLGHIIVYKVLGKSINRLIQHQDSTSSSLKQRINEIEEDTRRLLPEPTDPAILQAIETGCDLGKKAMLMDLERDFGYTDISYT
jgi:hypothetical protein